MNVPPPGAPPPGAHPAAEELAGLLDDESGADSRIRAHVRSCLECRDTLDRLGSVQLLLGTLPAVALPNSVAARIDRALAEEARRRGLPSARRRTVASWAKPALGAAAAAVLVGSGAMLLPGRVRNDRESSSSGVSQSAGGTAMSDGPASIPARVRQLVGATAQPTPRAAQAPAQAAPIPSAAGRKSAVDANLANCLRALRVRPTRLITASAGTFSGAPATVIVLTAQAGRTVDVRVVGPACGKGGADLRYHLDGLSLR